MSWEAAAAIGASAIGGLFGSKSNESAAREAALNREWQERMDNTKHQRAVKDLIAAGLNPILSSQYGGTVPSGASAAQTNPMSGFGESVNSALKMSSIDKQRLKIEQQQTNANEAHLLSQTNKANAEYDQLKEATELTRQQIQNAASENLIKSYMLGNIMPEQAKLLKAQAHAAMSSSSASSASAALDNMRKNLVELDVNKRSKSRLIEPEAEAARVVTEGVSNSADAVSDVSDAFWSIFGFGKQKRPSKRSKSGTVQLPSGQRKNYHEDIEYNH